MKTIIKSVVSGFIISILLSFVGFSGNCDSISNKVFRLHIIANSDSADDQSLKLKVRDRILRDFGEKFVDTSDIICAEEIAEKSLEEIEKVAHDEIRKNGYSYDVKAQIVHMYFNTRYYGEITMPAGYYDALRIVIGEGKGKNWWCVMFPPMCLPAAEAVDELGDVLNTGEMDIVNSGGKYILEFKILDLYAKLHESINDYVYEPILEHLNSDDLPYEAEFMLRDFSRD